MPEEVQTLQPDQKVQPFTSADVPAEYKPPEPPGQTPAAGKKKSKFVFFLVIILILAAIGAAGYWVYTNYANFMPTPVQPIDIEEPEETTESTVSFDEAMDSMVKEDNKKDLETLTDETIDVVDQIKNDMPTETDFDEKELDNM